MTRRWHPALIVAAYALLSTPFADVSAQTDEEDSPVTADDDGEASDEGDQDAGFLGWVKKTLKLDGEPPNDGVGFERDPGGRGGGGGGGGGGGDGGGAGGHN